MPPESLPAGLYERLITETMADAIARSGKVGRRRLGAQHLDRALADHVRGLVLSALGDLVDDDLDGRLALVTRVLGAVAEASAAVDLPGDLPAQGVDDRGAVLTWVAPAAIGVEQPVEPQRPRNGLVHPALLLNSAQDVSLVHELNLELASADRVDAVVSFLRISGLRLMERALRDLCARGALRLVTSTYVGATEARAVRELAQMGARVRVAYEEDGTRLHAKSWIFHRKSGLGTAYVGSSNLSRSAMVDGAEWNVRVTEAVTPDVVGRLVQAFDELSERCAGIISACASYTEYSPSGKGVHIICTRDEATFEGIEKETFKSNKVGVEVFSGRQYFTFTGRRWPEAPGELRLLDNKVARRLFATVEAARNDGAATPGDGEVARPAASSKSSPKSPGAQQRSMAETVAMAEEALRHLSPDDYEAWIEIGMACKADLGAAGFMVWDAWSQQSPKYVSKEMAKRWNGFKPSKITIGTVFGRAEDSGWVPPWKKAKARKRKPAAAPEASESISTPNEAPAEGGDGAAGGPPPDVDWQFDLIRKKGDVSACLANAELILANAAPWAGVIGYDEFAERTGFRKPLPFDRSGPERGDWTDDLDTQTTIWLQRAFKVEFSKTNVGQAVEARARRARFHPVREALAALPKWDGVRRLDTWLVKYLGVVPACELQEEYLAKVGTYFVRGMVQRVMRPGCKFDYCLVLEGLQGKGKSSIAKALAWHWFADTDLDLQNKDSLLALPGHWVYEIAELGSLMRAEERKQKSFLSRQEDEYRPPYGTRMTRVPRQNVFIGTTNEEEYLKDATGARRFWPVLVGDLVDHAGLLAERELLYAEALADFEAGERCYPLADEEQRLFVPEQAKRGMPEPFEDILRNWVKDQALPFSMTDAAMDCLKLTADKLTPAIVTRIGIALRKLGCGRKENRLAADPGERRLYLPPSLERQGIAASGIKRAVTEVGHGHF